MFCRKEICWNVLGVARCSGALFGTTKCTEWHNLAEDEKAVGAAAPRKMVQLVCQRDNKKRTASTPFRCCIFLPNGNVTDYRY